MFRPALTAIALAISATLARAHFVFIVPAADHTVMVLMSEELKPSDDVPISTIAGAKFFQADDAGHVSPVATAPSGEHALAATLAGDTRVVFGTADLGVMQHGNAKPNWLSYYPKTIVGDPFDAHATLGDKAPIELIPVGSPRKLQLRLLDHNKPIANADVTIVPDDGNQDSVKTDADGLTPIITQTGRCGFWTKTIETKTGEQNGKPYEEVRHYATLVIDIPNDAKATNVAPAPATQTEASLLKVDPFTPLPQPASSFGAVAADGYLYVYGGHIVDTHNYSTASVSGEFHRLNLADPKAWETLPGGPHAQGLNLAAADGKIYRVGGMSPQNKDGEKDDVRSIAGVAVYDPAAKTWTDLPPLPEPRSSHDVTVVDNTLYVLGGWTLTGDAADAKWHDHMLALDLSKPEAGWKSLPQPFKRRALIAAVRGKKIYAIGGFREDDEPSLDVNIYDASTEKWTPGPQLPGPELNGFGPAACVADGHVYVSVGDGSLLKLNDAGDGWERVAKTTPRIVHRMANAGDTILILGGAAKQKQLNLIEAVHIKPTAETAAR